MYLHGLLKENCRTCHLTTRKLEVQLLRVGLFTYDAKVALLIFLLLSDMCGRLLLVGHGTCDIKLDHNRQ